MYGFAFWAPGTEYRFCPVLGNEPHLLQRFGVLRPGGNEVDAGGLDAGVAQHIG